MTNPNPFVPKGSLLEQQSARRSRLKLGVFCVIAVSSLGLVAMLIQGCKREQPTDNALNEIPTNNPAITDATNPPAMDVSNNAAMIPPPMTNPPVIPQPLPPVAEPVAGSEYLVAKGDTLTTIAKAHHVSLKDLQSANPGVDSKHLKIKQKITIPSSTKSADALAPAATGVVADAGGELYTIKSGDTLDKIARAHHTTAKAIQAANNLTTTKILVGHKLKIPAKAETAPAPVEAPAVAAPVMPSVPAPASAPAPVK